jgi:hypothetical protein
MMDYRIFLSSTEQGYGGRRWYFRCPVSDISCDENLPAARGEAIREPSSPRADLQVSVRIQTKAFLWRRRMVGCY